MIRSINYASSSDARIAYINITNYTSAANATAIGNLTDNESGVVTSLNNSTIYSITSINNTDVITATVVLGTGSHNQSEVIRTLESAINEAQLQ